MYQNGGRSKKSSRLSRTRAIAREPRKSNAGPGRNTLGGTIYHLQSQPDAVIYEPVWFQGQIRMPQAILAWPIRRNASLDDVLEIFRTCLPEYGFKLVAPPPNAGDPTYAVASVWRHGDAQVASHKGATAALALLQATRSELTKLQAASSLADCNRCGGVGWFVTNKGAIEMCRHMTKPLPM